MNLHIKLIFLGVFISSFGAGDTFAVDRATRAQKAITTALGYIKTAETYYATQGLYQQSKNYSDINNEKALSAIKNLCKKACWRHLCGNKESGAKISKACHKMCPPNDIKNCAKQ